MRHQPRLERRCHRWQKLDARHARSRPEGRDQRCQLHVIRIGAVVGNRVVEKTQPGRVGEQECERPDARKLVCLPRLADERHDRAVGLDVDAGVHVRGSGGGDSGVVGARQWLIVEEGRDQHPLAA